MDAVEYPGMTNGSTLADWPVLLTPPPLPSLVFTLVDTGTTLSISRFCSAENSVCRAVWNSLFGLNTALALNAAPAPWRAKISCNSPMIS
jgi:hypothetical protein